MDLKEFIETVRLMRQEQQNFRLKLFIHSTTRNEADKAKAEAHLTSAMELEKKVDKLIQTFDMTNNQVGTL